MVESQVVFSPHPGQARMLTSDKRFVVAVAGIQSGKTMGACFWAQLRIQENPTGNGLICALSHDQLNNVVISKFFDLFPQYKKYYVKRDKTLYLPTGGKVFFRPLESPRFVEGITAHWAWIDEADLISYRAYLIVRGRLNATNGRLLMTTSLTDNGWIADYADRFDDDMFEIITWSSKDNPAFSKEEWEALKKELDPILFQRRYEAKLTKASGRVYGNFDFNRHVLPTGMLPEKDDRIKMYFIGFDWGYNDPTAIIVIAYTEKKNFIIVDEFYKNEVLLDEIERVTKEFIERYQPMRALYGDYQNKTLMQEMGMRLRRPILIPNKEINTGINKIRNFIHQNRVYVWQNCKNVIREFKQYRFDNTITGFKEEPKDEFNHTMDAIRYVLATYPFPAYKNYEPKKKEEVEEIPEFWLRKKKWLRNRSNLVPLW